MAEENYDTVQLSSQWADGDDQDACTLMRSGGKLMIWFENGDGEASDLFTEEQFEAMVTEARKLMGWAG